MLKANRSDGKMYYFRFELKRFSGVKLIYSDKGLNFYLSRNVTSISQRTFSWEPCDSMSGGWEN